MRKIGYILLIFGFLWLTLWCAPSVGPLIRSIGIENFKKYPEGGKYSGKDVCHAIRSALIEYQENAHGVMLPAVLMLVGGILLDVANRRARPTDSTKQDEMLNNLTARQGSIAERTEIAKRLDYAHLQKAVPYSEQAKIEWERRANEKKWYEKPLGLIAIGVAIGVITAAIIFFLFGCTQFQAILNAP